MQYSSHNHTEPQQIALEYLRLARKAHTRVKQDRGYWAALAREHGLKWTEIGDALGLTADGARGLARTHKQREREEEAHLG